MGFWEVGFAPVTTAPQRDHAISDAGFDDLLGAVPGAGPGLPAGVAAEPAPRLLERPRDAAGDPPGARQGLSVRRRHRAARRGHRRPGVAVPPLRRLGRAPLRLGDRGHGPREAGLVPRGAPHHPQDRLPASCWARPICAGGCYHEAHTRYGDTTGPNLHYCEWIRGWTHTCLEIYGELAVKNPAFLRAVRRRQTMKHLNAINRRPRGSWRSTEAELRRSPGRRRPAAGRQPPQQPEAPHIPPGCSMVFSPGWEADRRRHRRAVLSRWSAICSTATWAASGRPTSPISSITRPTGRPSAPSPRRTGARSTWCSPG